MIEDFKLKYIKNVKGSFLTGVFEKKYIDSTRYIGRYRNNTQIK